MPVANLGMMERVAESTSTNGLHIVRNPSASLRPGSPGLGYDTNFNHNNTARKKTDGPIPTAVLKKLGGYLGKLDLLDLRRVCRKWEAVLSACVESVFVGPSLPTLQNTPRAVAEAYPDISKLHLYVSASREYDDFLTQARAFLTSFPVLTHLIITEHTEVGELLSDVNVWELLAFSAPLLSSRLKSLEVNEGFWEEHSHFTCLQQLTALTQLRLRRIPLESPAEIEVLAALTHLRVLEFGVSYDGNSSDHELPRALALLSNLINLEVLCLPHWRKSVGGTAHPLAPALSVALRQMTQLRSLQVDGRFGHLGVVSQLTSLTEVCSAVPMSMVGWQAISKLPNLQVLGSMSDLRSRPSSRSGSRFGGDLSGLSTTSLTAAELWISHANNLIGLHSFPLLRKLHLSGDLLEPTQQQQALNALIRLSTLTDFQSQGCLTLNSAVLNGLAKAWPGVQSFTFTGLISIGDPGFAALKQWTGLQRLTLNAALPNLPPHQQAAYAMLHAIQPQFDLSQMPPRLQYFRASRLTVRFQVCAPLPANGLRALHLSSCFLSSHSLQHLTTECTQIQELTLRLPYSQLAPHHALLFACSDPFAAPEDLTCISNLALLSHLDLELPLNKLRHVLTTAASMRWLSRLRLGVRGAGGSSSGSGSSSGHHSDAEHSKLRDAFRALTSTRALRELRLAGTGMDAHAEAIISLLPHCRVSVEESAESSDSRW